MRRTSLATSALNVLLRPATAGMRTPDRAFDALVVTAERRTRADAAAVGSVCSMVETTQALHVRKPDPHTIGRTWLELQASAVEPARAARAEAVTTSFVDVPYAWLVDEPHARMPEVYDRIGATWTDRDAANLDAVLARTCPGRSHEYELSRYGLTAADVGAAFGDYADRYCAV